MGQGGAGALFRGNLRKDRQEVWDEVRAKIYDKFGNKYEIFMLEELDNVVRKLSGPVNQSQTPEGPEFLS